jgi:hypothetical protein
MVSASPNKKGGVAMKQVFKMFVFPILMVVLFSFPAFSEQQQEFTGKIVGVNCFLHDLDCNSDMYEFYHLQFEPDFVLLIGKDKHYMLPNVPRDVKVRIAGETVTVTGNTSKQELGINVESLKLNGKVVWSKELQRKKLYEESQRYGGN